MARILLSVLAAAAASVATAIPSARQAESYAADPHAPTHHPETCDQLNANAGYHATYPLAVNDVCDDFMCGNDHAATACEDGESYVKICDGECKGVIQGSTMYWAHYDITVTFGSKGCVKDIVLGSSVANEWEITKVIMKGQNGYCSYPTLDTPSLFKVTDPSQVPVDVGNWCTPYVNQNYQRADISHVSLCVAPKEPENNECPTCEECDKGPSCGECEGDMHFDTSDFTCKCNEHGFVFDGYNKDTGMCCVKAPCGDDEVEGPGGICYKSASETAFAGDGENNANSCFIDLKLATRWGWVQTYDTSALAEVQGPYKMWAGAAKCDTKKGFESGVAALYPGTQTVVITPIPVGGVEQKYIYLKGAHVHIVRSDNPIPEAKLFPKSLAPGQYNAVCTPLDDTIDSSISCSAPAEKVGAGKYIHWIAHANVETPAVTIFN